LRSQGHNGREAGPPLEFLAYRGLKSSISPVALLIFSVPGVSHFVPLKTPQDSPANQNQQGFEGLTQEDINTIHRESMCRSRYQLTNQLSRIL